MTLVMSGLSAKTALSGEDFLGRERLVPSMLVRWWTRSVYSDCLAAELMAVITIGCLPW